MWGTRRTSHVIFAALYSHGEGIPGCHMSMLLFGRLPFYGNNTSSLSELVE